MLQDPTLQVSSFAYDYVYFLFCSKSLLLVFSYVEGITGLSTTTLVDNWSADYQPTNDAGVPDPNGHIYWDFKCVFLTANSHT